MEDRVVIWLMISLLGLAAILMNEGLPEGLGRARAADAYGRGDGSLCSGALCVGGRLLLTALG